MANGHTIGVISLKGGVGKTTVVSNLAAALAHDYNRQVLLVDANFSTPHCGLHVGLINPEKTIHNVLRDEISPFQALYAHEAGFHIMPGSLSPKEVSPGKLAQKIAPLRSFYDVILLDSSPALNGEMLATMNASDVLLVVSSLDYPTLSATLHAIKIARQKKTPIIGLVINKARNKKFELSIADIEKTAGIPVIAVIPEDVKVLEALSATTPVSLYAPKRSPSIAYRRLAGLLVGEEFKDPRFSAQFRNATQHAMKHTKDAAHTIHTHTKKLLAKKVRIG